MPLLHHPCIYPDATSSEIRLLALSEKAILSLASGLLYMSSISTFAQLASSHPEELNLDIIFSRAFLKYLSTATSTTGEAFAFLTHGWQFKVSTESYFSIFLTP